MENQELVFNIQLNLDQVNVILATMGKLPYESIAPLMNSIQMQASSQMQQYQAANSVNDSDSSIQ
jgi:hypothetical protein